MIGSGLIIYEVLRNPKNRTKVYHRLLLAMSICDFNTSFWYFLSTWPIPKDTANVFAPSGTRASCTAQGFFIQFGIATPLYNAALAFYYLLIIRYQWKEKRMKRAEKYLHAVPLVWASGTSLASLGLTLLNNANLWCWISSVPLSCKGSYRNNGVNDCERGNNSWIYRWAFFYGPLWAAIVCSGVWMLLTYLAVRKTEMASSKWRSRAPAAAASSTVAMSSVTRKKKEKEDNDRKHSKQVASQAFYYLMAFFFSWLFGTLTRFIQMTSGKTYYPIILLMAIFTPMQGFLNYLVYMRPRWISYRKKHPEWGRCMAFAMLFRGELHSSRDTVTEHSTVGATTKRGKYFSAISQHKSALRRSSISRRSSNDISASVVSEEHKEEEHCPDDVEAMADTVGPGAEEDVDVENGSSSVRVVRSIMSSSIVEEGSIHDGDDDKEVHFEDEGNLAVAQ